MNKNRKMVIVLLFAFILCFSLAGCTLQDKIEEYSSGKEQCYLNTENVTRFSYKGNDYTILADTVSNGGLGEWIGYIRQLAAIDENGKILLQENVEPATFQSLADLAEKAPEAAYIIPFLNVYAAPNADDYLIVDVNGGYHKAVISENVKDSDTVFDFKKTENENEIIFEIFKDNNNIGSCFVSIFETCGCIHNVEINEAFRGNGYSKLLLQYSLYDIKNICQNIILHVTKENVPAYNLYKKLNFITTSEIIYYDNL